jgi:metal-responsive CopG/Arc/MetJ family transcriptional regulator
MTTKQTTKKMGRPNLFTNRKTVSFDMDQTMYDKLELVARNSGVKKSTVLRLALANFLREKRSEQGN